MLEEQKILKSEKGQGIIEFIIFLPFMLMMYSVMISISNAINASINQQKVTRSFFYYRNMNNSTFPSPTRQDPEPSASWQVFGFQIIGWMEKFADGTQSPQAPCFKVDLPFKNDEEEKCEENYSKTSTKFIRVQTVYGVCGATYIKNSDYNIAFPRGAMFATGDNLRHCVITE